ncbi:MAG: flagellar type III secretion system pore protein FliP [Nitrospinota bacterium]
MIDYIIKFSIATKLDEVSPSLTIALGDASEPVAISTALKVMGLMTILSIAPSIFISLTSFVRIIVVMSFLRQAIGIPTIPPNQVLAGLAVFMTFFIMKPVFLESYEKGFVPFNKEEITVQEFYDRSTFPFKKFMLNQTRAKDLELFVNISKSDRPKSEADLSLAILIPSFLISELRTAFTIGFLIYIPFLVLDMVIASVLMSMGMMMLPPVMISLPFKIILFVLVDGWHLVAGSMIKSFGI